MKILNLFMLLVLSMMLFCGNSFAFLELETDISTDVKGWKVVKRYNRMDDFFTYDFIKYSTCTVKGKYSEETPELVLRFYPPNNVKAFVWTGLNLGAHEVFDCRIKFDNESPQAEKMLVTTDFESLLFQNSYAIQVTIWRMNKMLFEFTPKYGTTKIAEFQVANLFDAMREVGVDGFDPYVYNPHKP